MGIKIIRNPPLLKPTYTVLTLFFIFALLLTNYAFVYQRAMFSVFARPSGTEYTQSRISFITTFPSLYFSKLTKCGNKYLEYLVINNWLGFADEVIILADSPEICVKIHVNFPTLKCMQHMCLSTRYGKPTMPCLFWAAELNARNEFILFSNPDIIFNGLEQSLAVLSHQFRYFVALGVRTDMELDTMCNSHQVTTDGGIITLAASLGRAHGTCGIDYFLFTKGSLPLSSMPPFIIGNWRWDNWLLDELLRYNVTPVVDVSKTVAAVHLVSTSIPLINRTAAAYNNALWHASQGWQRPDPFPAGLGDMLYAPFFTTNNGTYITLRQNETNLGILRKYNRESKESQIKLRLS